MSDTEIHALWSPTPLLGEHNKEERARRARTRATERFTPFQQDAVSYTPQWKIVTYLGHNSWQPQPTGPQRGGLRQTLECLGIENHSLKKKKCFCIYLFIYICPNQMVSCSEHRLKTVHLILKVVVEELFCSPM